MKHKSGHKGKLQTQLILQVVLMNKKVIVFNKGDF